MFIAGFRLFEFDGKKSPRFSNCTHAQSFHDKFVVSKPKLKLYLKASFRASEDMIHFSSLTLINEHLVLVILKIPSCSPRSGTQQGWSAWQQCCWVSAPHLGACGHWPQPLGAWRCWAGWGWGGSCCGDRAACREPSTPRPRSSRLWSTTARRWQGWLARPCAWCRRRRSSPEGLPCKCAHVMSTLHPTT